MAGRRNHVNNQMASTSHLQFAPTLATVTPNSAFGTVNSEVNQTATAGQVITGPSRAFPGPNQALLFNVSAPGGYDFYIDCQLQGTGWASDRPRKFSSSALPAGTDGYEYNPAVHGAPNYRVVVTAKGAGPVVVTSQYLPI